MFLDPNPNVMKSQIRIKTAGPATLPPGGPLVERVIVTVVLLAYVKNHPYFREKNLQPKKF